MKNFILSIAMVFICGLSFAGSMLVTTGQGYYLWHGQPVMKYELPLGEHPLTDGLDYVEVNSLPDLANVQLNAVAVNAYLSQ